MEDLYVDMKEYLKYVLDKNTDREQYIKCYHMLLCFLKECIYICLYAHTPHTHTHTLTCAQTLWKDIQDTGNMIVAGDENQRNEDQEWEGNLLFITH